jgi:hypothetical protein
MMKKQDIDLDQILLWVLENKDDTDKMDKLSYLVFSFTSRFKAKQKTYQNNDFETDLENGVSIGK